MYPAVLVLLTSGLGLAAIHRLRQAGLVGPLSAWLASCIYSAKLAMLVIPEVRFLSRLPDLSFANSFVPLWIPKHSLKLLLFWAPGMVN